MSRSADDYAILGDCLKCGGFVYDDDQYEDLGDGCFIHASCLEEEELEEVDKVKEARR